MATERRHHTWMGLAWVLSAGIGLAGCERSAPKKPALTPTPSAETPTASPSASITSTPATLSNATAATSPPSKDLTAPTPEPAAIAPAARLSDADIKLAQEKIKSASAYPARLEARRALLYPLCAAEQTAEAKPVFEGMLTDIVTNEGEKMAQRAGLADVQNLASQKRHRAAIALGEQLISKWSTATIQPDALDVLASSHLDLQEYAEAEQVWRRVVEEHDAWPRVEWAWRRLALAQLLQGHFDDSLATLAIMTEKFAAGDMGEYARARKGYVLMAAGRFKDAQAAYTDFLASCKHSKYCDLVRQQERELEDTKRVAMARAAKSSRP